MYEAMNSILVSIHESLFPARGVISIAGILYLIATGFYFQWRRSNNLISQKRIIRKAILHAGLAAFIASYGALLEVQEPSFLEHLIILLPICTLFVPGLLMLFLWIGYFFVSKSKINN